MSLSFNSFYNPMTSRLKLDLLKTVLLAPSKSESKT